MSLVSKTRPISIVAAAFGVAAVVVPACRKPSPDEIVFTGAPIEPSSGGVGSGGGAGGSGGRGGSSGDSGVDAGGSAGFPGELPGAAPDVQFTKANLLAQIADCAISHYQAFETRAAVLRDSTQTFAGDRSSDNADAARNAWIEAIALWQVAELFQFGPAARPKSPGAQDFRDNIYAFPLNNRCKIEEHLVSEAYASPNFTTATLINARGLAASEYLLFFGGTDNACSKFSVINAQGTWAALDPATIAARKSAYAAAAAKDIHVRAQGLVAAWDPGAGNFRHQLVDAGAGSTVFATDQDALNAVSDALFYTDRELKDLKLGKPIGLVECFTPTCPEAVESPYAFRSTDHVRANLVGLRRLFEGCYADGAGLGFDDWLRAAGAPALADNMVANLAGARAAADALDPPLEQAVTSDPARVKTLHAAVKKFTDELKSVFVTVLNLDLPEGVEGDND
jgi:predicted lipoprotein